MSSILPPRSVKLSGPRSRNWASVVVLADGTYSFIRNAYHDGSNWRVAETYVSGAFRPYAIWSDSVNQKRLELRYGSASSATAGDVISWGRGVLTVESLIVTGTGLITNLNADLLDSQEGAFYQALANATGTLTNSQLNDMGAATIKGRAQGAGTGTPSDLGVASLVAILETLEDGKINPYRGRFSCNGAGTPISIRLPAGWSLSKGATGIYVLTHTMGTANYTPVCSLFDTSGLYTVTVAAKTSGLISFATFDTNTQTLTDLSAQDIFFNIVLD